MSEVSALGALKLFGCILIPQTIEKLKALRCSSLFITKPLIEKAITEVENSMRQAKK